MSNVTNNKPSTNLIALLNPMPVLISWTGKKARSGAGWMGDLRQLDPHDLDLYIAKPHKFEALYGRTGAEETADRKELFFVIQLADALAAKSLRKVRQALNGWIGPDETDKEMHWPPGSNKPKPPVLFFKSLMFRLNVRIVNGGATPTVYWSDKDRRLALGLFCRDMSAALFLLAIKKIGVSSMGHCKGCQGVLIADRANKVFCDSKCRSRYFMRQLRDRQKKAHKKGKVKL